MVYSLEIHPKCQQEIKKACNKNSELERALRKKITEILDNPHHYKPLRYDMAGEYRVHIMKSFVLRFEIAEDTQTVRFIAFSHHDEAYRR